MGTSRAKKTPKQHGIWVRSKALNEVGRIAYTVDGGAWIVWQSGGASWRHASDLTRLKRPAERWWSRDGELHPPTTNATITSTGQSELARKEEARMTDEFDDLDMEDLDEAEEERAPKRKSQKKASGDDKPKGISASQVAEKLGTDPKTFRAWLRRKMEAGEVEYDHEARQRYSWVNWKDSQLVEIMKLWKAEPHTKGGRKKSDDGDEVAAKRTSRKKPTTRKKKSA